MCVCVCVCVCVRVRVCVCVCRAFTHSTAALLDPGPNIKIKTQTSCNFLFISYEDVNLTFVFLLCVYSSVPSDNTNTVLESVRLGSDCVKINQEIADVFTPMQQQLSFAVFFQTFAGD